MQPFIANFMLLVPLASIPAVLNDNEVKKSTCSTETKNSDSISDNQ